MSKEEIYGIRTLETLLPGYSKEEAERLAKEMPKEKEAVVVPLSEAARRKEYGG